MGNVMHDMNCIATEIYTRDLHVLSYVMRLHVRHHDLSV